MRLPPPILIDKPADEELSWLASIYGLRGSLREPGKDLRAISEVFTKDRLDRFHDHLVRLDRSSDLVPRVCSAGIDSPWPCLSTKRMRLRPASIELYLGHVPPAGLVSLLVIGVELRSVEDAVSLLQETCFHKDELRIGSRCLLCCLRDVFSDDRWTEPVDFDRDVTQVLSLGRDLRAAIRGAAGADQAKVMQMVYRECAPFRRGSGAIRWPAELNRPRSGFCAHGRGVTVVAGEARHVFWGLVLTAAELTSAAGCLRTVRLEATKALGEIDKFRIGSSSRDGVREAGKKVRAAREKLARWSKRLGRHELDLSFGVAMYLDTVRTPDIVLTSYRSSLAESLELPNGIASTGRLLSRFKAIIEARRDELQYVEAQIEDIRRARIDVAVFVVTLIVAPVTLLFAFLGATLRQIKPDGKASLFGLSHYWWFYAAFGGVFLLGLCALAYSRHQGTGKVRTLLPEDDAQAAG